MPFSFLENSAILLSTGKGIRMYDMIQVSKI